MPWFRRKSDGGYLWLDPEWQFYAYHVASGLYVEVPDSEVPGVGQPEGAPTPPLPEDPPPPDINAKCPECGLPGGAHTPSCSALTTVEPSETPRPSGTANSPRGRGRPAARSKKD